MPKTSSLLLIALLGLTLAGCARHSASADARLQAIYNGEWKWRTDQQPDDEDATRPISAHLPRVDPATEAMRLKYWQDVAARLRRIPRAQLSGPEQLNYDIYSPQIAVLIANQRFRDYEMPANSDTSFWTDIGYTARRPFRHPEDYEHWISQMQDIPRYFQEEMDEMRAGLKRGFTPPRVTMEGRDASITAVTEAAPEASLFYTPFKDMPGIAPDKERRCAAQAVRVIREAVQPAYARAAEVHARRSTCPACARRSRPRTCRTARTTTAPRSASSPPSTWTRRRSTSSACRRSRGCTRRWSTAMSETGFKGDFPGVPQVPAHRSALLREDARGAADARSLDRQALRRQGVAVLRLPAARALRHQAGAG